MAALYAPAAMAPEHEWRTVARRGCHLAYRVAGDGSPAVFIQGVGVHGDGWLPQVEALRSGHRCLWFDNRGLGRSQPRGEPLRIEQMASDVLALMDEAGFGSAHLVGHSMGGTIALELAASARERVRSLALLCTFARFRDAFRRSPRLAWIGLRSRLGTRRMRRHAFLEFVMPPAERRGADLDVLAARLEPVFGHDLGDSPPVAAEQARALLTYDGRPRMAQLAGLPTLVVSARHDPIAPPALGRALASGIGGASYVEIPIAAHGAPVQCAEHINALLRKHFARADLASGTDRVPQG